MKSLEDIVTTHKARLGELGPLHAAALEVQQVYDGELVVPLPELDKNEKAAVPNLLKQGLDQMAMRISSVMADVYYPPDRPGFKNSEENARTKRRANLGWWEHSKMKLLDARRARHLLGYATSPVVIRPDFDAGVPSWQLRHPLCAFPAGTTNPDDVLPDDCIFTYTRTLGWLKRQYPDQYLLLRKNQQSGSEQKITLIEYMDDMEIVLAVMGETTVDPYNTQSGTMPYVEVERIENRAGIPLAIVPGRITLNKRQGAYEGMVGLYQRQAALMALEYIAVKKGVFADEWLVARPNEVGTIVQQADGLRGIMGKIQGGELHTVVNNPSYQTNQTIALLDQYQKMEGGIPNEFFGQSTTNVRTGKRGDSILSAVVDFPVQEAHNIFEVSKEDENRVAVATARAYFGNEKKSFYVNWKGAKGHVDYTPNDDFLTDSNTVSYAHAGADVNSLIVGIGQMIGVGLISKELGRELNPMVDDPEREKDRVIDEALEQAQLAALQQAAVAGQLAPADLSRIRLLVRTNQKELDEAIQQVQEEIQSRQATSGPAGTPEAPVAPGSPEAQPGLGAPGSTAPAGTIAPTENEQGLGALMSALRSGARSGAAA